MADRTGCPEVNGAQLPPGTLSCSPPSGEEAWPSFHQDWCKSVKWALKTPNKQKKESEANRTCAPPPPTCHTSVLPVSAPARFWGPYLQLGGSRAWRADARWSLPALCLISGVPPPHSLPSHQPRFPRPCSKLMARHHGERKPPFPPLQDGTLATGLPSALGRVN